jgi:hypothetical protein
MTIPNRNNIAHKALRRGASYVDKALEFVTDAQPQLRTAGFETACPGALALLQEAEEKLLAAKRLVETFAEEDEEGT